MTTKEARPSDECVREKIVRILHESTGAAVRERKAKIQQEYMIARRMLQDSYADYEADELPVDMQRLKRDLEITRDLRCAAAEAEVQEALRITERVLGEVAEADFVTYGRKGSAPEPKRKGPKPRALPRGTPSRVAKHLSNRDMIAIMNMILHSGAEGTLVGHFTTSLKLTSPPAVVAVKRYLVWLRKEGHVSVKASRGKGTRYVPCKTLANYIRGVIEEGS